MTRAELAKLARTRLVPIAFLTAIALIANSTCHKGERTKTTIVLDLGDAAARVRGVEAEVFVGGDLVGTFRRVAHGTAPIGTCKFPAALPDKNGTIHIEVDLGNGDVRPIDRSLHADDNATLTVPLAPDLR